eukprot:SAG31_NODE_8710_length_1401_cov_1.354839_2_plen_263_part_00
MLKKIGGNSSLSVRGEAYARALAAYIHTHILVDKPEAENLDNVRSTMISLLFGPLTGPYVCGWVKASSMHARLWTSSLRRTIATGKYIRHDVVGDDGWVTMRPRVWRGLDEIYAGVFDGMTCPSAQLCFECRCSTEMTCVLSFVCLLTLILNADAEIEQRFPAEFTQRSNDKLGYRYPRGESYLEERQVASHLARDVRFAACRQSDHHDHNTIAVGAGRSVRRRAVLEIASGASRRGDKSGLLSEEGRADQVWRGTSCGCGL